MSEAMQWLGVADVTRGLAHRNSKEGFAEGVGDDADHATTTNGGEVMDEVAWLSWLAKSVQVDQAKDGEAADETVRSLRETAAQLHDDQVRIKAELVAAMGDTGALIPSAADIEKARQEIRAAKRELDNVTGWDDEQANALGCAEIALTRALSALDANPVALPLIDSSTINRG